MTRIRRDAVRGGLTLGDRQGDDLVLVIVQPRFAGQAVIEAVVVAQPLGLIDIHSRGEPDDWFNFEKEKVVHVIDDFWID